MCNAFGASTCKTPDTNKYNKYVVPTLLGYGTCGIIRRSLSSIVPGGVVAVVNDGQHVHASSNKGCLSKGRSSSSPPVRCATHTCTVIEIVGRQHVRLRRSDTSKGRRMFYARLANLTESSYTLPCTVPRTRFEPTVFPYSRI